MLQSHLARAGWAHQGQEARLGWGDLHRLPVCHPGGRQGLPGGVDAAGLFLANLRALQLQDPGACDERNDQPRMRRGIRALWQRPHAPDARERCRRLLRDADARPDDAQRAPRTEAGAGNDLQDNARGQRFIN